MSAEQHDFIEVRGAKCQVINKRLKIKDLQEYRDIVKKIRDGELNNPEKAFFDFYQSQICPELGNVYFDDLYLDEVNDLIGQCHETFNFISSKDSTFFDAGEKKKFEAAVKNKREQKIKE